MPNNIVEYTTSIAVKCTCGRYLTVKYAMHPFFVSTALEINIEVEPCPVCTGVLKAFFEQGHGEEERDGKRRCG